MGKLHNNQNGASHIILIVVFLLVLAGLVGFAYTRISDKNSSDSAETSQDESVADDDNESDVIDDSEDPVDDLDTE